MIFDSEKLVSISELNQNFSKCMSLLKKHNALIVLKNNKPVFVLVDYDVYEKEIGKL